MQGNPLVLIPIVVFLAVSIGLALFVRMRARRSADGTFISEYFIGSRSLGGFVLAMTTIATYGSVSSFVGGPGQAWSVGFGWVYMAAVQVTALFLLFGIMGKKMALVSRRLNAVTVIDVIRARYKSDAVANVSAAIIVLFFAAMMVAQFVGGAKLFEAVTGYSYIVGLALFGIAVIFYTTVGGFRGVAITDALCGVMMIVGIVVLAAGILSQGGGYEQILLNIRASKPSMLEPLGGGEMPVGLYITQWLLVGVFTFSLPQSVVRCMGFKDERSLKNALVMGTVILGVMMILVTALGVLAKGVLPGTLADYGGSVDNIIPIAIAQCLPPWLAGIAIIGPIAASISTVSSLLISSSSSIVKDVYLHYRAKSLDADIELRDTKINGGEASDDKRVSRLSQVFTLALGLVVFVLAIVPPDVIWKINMFAFGGLETAFCWVLVLGLFWKRANSTGAVLSMVGGVVVYCTLMALGIKPFGLHQIVVGISLSLVLMLVGSSIADRKRASKPDPVFFP